MYLIKVVEFQQIVGSMQEVVTGLYSTQFVRIERNLITLIRTPSEHPDTVIVPKDGKVYIMDGEGNTIDTYYP